MLVLLSQAYGACSCVYTVLFAHLYVLLPSYKVFKGVPLLIHHDRVCHFDMTVTDQAEHGCLKMQLCITHGVL